MSIHTRTRSHVNKQLEGAPVVDRRSRNLSNARAAQMILSKDGIGNLNSELYKQGLHSKINDLKSGK